MIYPARWYFYVCLIWVSPCFRRALWSFSRFCTLELNLYTHLSNKDWKYFQLRHLSPCFQTLNTPQNVSVNIGNHCNHDYSDYQTKLTLHPFSFQLHLHISFWDCELFSVVCSKQSFAKKKKTCYFHPSNVILIQHRSNSRSSSAQSTFFSER